MTTTTDKPLSYAQHLTARARTALKDANIKGVTVATKRCTYDRELILPVCASSSPRSSPWRPL